MGVSEFRNSTDEPQPTVRHLFGNEERDSVQRLFQLRDLFFQAPPLSQHLLFHELVLAV